MNDAKMMFLVALFVIAISAGVGYLFVPALTNIIDVYFALSGFFKKPDKGHPVMHNYQ